MHLSRRLVRIIPQRTEDRMNREQGTCRSLRINLTVVRGRKENAERDVTRHRGQGRVPDHREGKLKPSATHP